MSDQRWQQSMDILVKAGIMEKPLNVKEVYTNDLIEKAAAESKEFAKALFAGPPRD
jgi:hypothetical protein